MARSTPTSAARLRLIASEILEIADQYEIPSHSMTRVEMLIGRVETAADDVRAVARGRR